MASAPLRYSDGPMGNFVKITCFCRRYPRLILKIPRGRRSSYWVWMAFCCRRTAHWEHSWCQQLFKRCWCRQWFNWTSKGQWYPQLLRGHYVESEWKCGRFWKQHWFPSLRRKGWHFVGSGIDTDIDDFASIRRTGIRAYVAWSGRDADGIGLPTMPGQLGILDGL